MDHSISLYAVSTLILFQKIFRRNHLALYPLRCTMKALSKFVINSREDLSNRYYAITLVKSTNNTALGAISQIVFLGVEILLDNICT
jgi:hypothetical protein